MNKLKYWDPEPSLSSDVKSMLHDEHSKRLDAIESTLAQWQATVWAKQIEQRVAALEHALSKLHDIDNEPIFPEPLPREELD